MESETLHGSRSKATSIAIWCVVVALGGVALAQVAPEHGGGAMVLAKTWTGWSAAGLYSLLSLMALYRAVWPDELILDRSGFRIRGLFWPNAPVSWGDVESLHPQPEQSPRWLAYRLTSVARRARRRSLLPLSKDIDGLFPAVLDLDPDALKERVEAWRSERMC